MTHCISFLRSPLWLLSLTLGFVLRLTNPAFASTPTAPVSPPKPCGAPEHRQLDFWLGHWDVRWTTRSGAIGTGTNVITPEHGGCVVQEAFNGGPSTGGLIGHSVSVYQPASGQWRQTWVDNQGGYFALVGTREAGRLVLVARGDSDAKPEQRMVFDDITPKSLTWRWQRSADAGKTWADQWVIFYTRRSEASASTDPTAASAMADKLLGAVGGRAAWAAARNTVNDSQQFRAEAPVEARAVISLDFMQPRWRIDTTAPGLTLTRVVDGVRNWRRTREGQIAPITPTTLREDQQWYVGHVYRTISRMARNDPALELRLGSEGRLEVFEAAKRIAWFKLNAAGEPYAFAGVGEGPGLVSGPWTAQEQGIRHPIWVASADGTWRSSLNRLQVNAAFADELFRQPN